jgi:hypothetical protein
VSSSVLDRIPARVVLLIGWLGFLVCAFPGVMTWDSFGQLGEARSGVYSDGHPPVMAYVWSVLDRIVPGPFGMLVLQSWSFLLGSYLILRRAMRPTRAAWAASAFLLFPPVLTPLMVIWKDCLMAGALLLGVAGLLDGRRSIRVAGLAALMFATLLRHNAPAATLPLVMLLLAREIMPGWSARLRRAGIAIAVAMAITVTAFGINDLLTDRRTHLWHSSVAVMDIVGIQLRAGELSDEEWRRLLDGAPLVVHDDIDARARKAYKAFDFSPLVSGPQRIFDLHEDRATTPAQRAAIERAWREQVTRHPWLYVRHRVGTFRHVLALGHRPPGMMVVPRAHPLATEMALDNYPRRWTGFQAALDDALFEIALHTPFWRPVLYLVLALALLWPARRQRDAFALLVSGISMELALLPIAPTPDYRYSHWMVVTTLLAAILLLARARARANQPTETSPLG